MLCPDVSCNIINGGGLIMKSVKLMERYMFERYCPSLVEPADDCYCTKAGSEYLEKMLHFCCKHFNSCEIYLTKYR